MRVLACLLILASGAAAQDVPIDRDAVEACFETGHAARDPRPACVGDAAALCQGRPGGDTTLGIADCLMAETAIWGEIMGTTLERKSQVFAQEDPELPQAVSEAQAAWTAYRDAACGVQYRIWAEGSIRTIVAGHCHLHKTAARALELKMLGEME